jgi:hypothetical protein
MNKNERFYNINTFELRQIQDMSKESRIMKFYKENITILSNLRNYFNENLEKTGKTYNCVYCGISDDYRFKFNYKRFNLSKK